MYHRSDEKEIPKWKGKRKRTKEGEWKANTNSGNTERRRIIRTKKNTEREICIVSSRTRHDTCVSHKLHPVYIVRTMICSYFGISFFEFAKNVYLQILYENIYRKKKLDMKYKVLKSSSGIVNPFRPSVIFRGRTETRVNSVAPPEIDFPLNQVA